MPDKLGSPGSNSSQFAHRASATVVAVAPGAQNRKQPRKQREGADRHAWINFGFVRRIPEGHSMSGGANDERKIQHHKCVSKKSLRHTQILSDVVQRVWNPRRPVKPNQTARCCPVCLLRYKKAARPSSPVLSNNNEDGSGETYKLSSGSPYPPLLTAMGYP